jgi:hypothetical protein
MGLFSSKKSIVGAVLMVVGTLAFLPSIAYGTPPVVSYALVPAAGLLTVGTWLVGTSEEGRPV